MTASLAVVTAQSEVGSASTSGGAPSAPSLPSPDALPVVAGQQYRLSGAARPFLVFWINRDNVGGGRMTWRRGADGTLSLELLTGSDPQRAPFHTNRWGYMREVIRGDAAELLAVKSETEEETIDEARTSATSGKSSRLLVFIRERVTARDPAGLRDQKSGKPECIRGGPPSILVEVGRGMPVGGHLARRRGPAEA